MKTAFNILPQAEQAAALNLLIEAGWYGISFVWYKKDPIALEGILTYNFNERITAGEVADNLERTITKEPLFREQFLSVLIAYNFKESLLVPGVYYNEANNHRLIDTVFGTGTESILKADKLKVDTAIAQTADIYNIYRIPGAVQAVMAAHFPQAETIHSTSLQLAHKGDVVICCIVFHNTIKVILFNRNQLQVVQQFGYKTPEDVVYHLLNTCGQYDVPAAEVSLLLSGMIDAASNLYQELYKYFLNIGFDNVPDAVFLSAGIKAFPAHFFSHLTALVKCVS